MQRYLFIATALCLVFSVSASAQEPDEQARPIVIQQDADAPPPFANLKGFSEDYQIGPGDQLDIQVVGHEDLHQSLRVSNSGEISFPMLGLVRVADMTAFEVEEELVRRFRAAGLVEQPELVVFIREYHAKPVYVYGAVVNPGEYVMSQELTVVDAVLLAGGLRFNAADEALIHRRVSGGQNETPASLAANPTVDRPGVEVLKVDIRPLKEGRFHIDALPLRRGDVLVVPDLTLNAFYVVGEVVDPRNFFYIPGKTLMASQAISWAAGPTPTAKMSDGMLVRFDEQGNRTEMKVDYAAILQGRQPDFQIRANDIIFIPGSKVKTIAHGMLMLSDTMVMSASFRVARSYQMPERVEQPNAQPQPGP